MLRLSRHACCVWSAPRTSTWCGVVRRYFGYGCILVLEFACVAVCSLLVRQHGSHACKSRAEAFLLDDFVSSSRNDEVMRNNLCGGIALGLTLVPSHPPALALCVFSRRFRCFPSMAVVFVLLAVVWKSVCDWASVRVATCGLLLLALSSVLVISFGSFGFPELVEVVASFFLALFRLLCRIGW